MSPKPPGFPALERESVSAFWRSRTRGSILRIAHRALTSRTSRRPCSRTLAAAAASTGFNASSFGRQRRAAAATTRFTRSFHTRPHRQAHEARTRAVRASFRGMTVSCADLNQPICMSAGCVSMKSRAMTRGGHHLGGPRSETSRIT